MKKQGSLLLLAVMALFVVTGAVAQGAGAEDGGILGVPRLGVTFDGYSDGLAMKATGPFVYGNHCGTFLDLVWGVKYNGASHMNNDPTGRYDNIHTVVTADGRWAHFTLTGLLNEGTWSSGCPGNSPDLPSSTNPQVESANTAQEPIMALQIQVDGYCNLFDLQVSGDSRDVALAATGSTCGCGGGWQVFGSRLYARTHLSNDAASGYGKIQSVFDDSGQWRLFNNTGLINSGTWSWGGGGCAAPMAGPGLPSMFDSK